MESRNHFCSDSLGNNLAQNVFHKKCSQKNSITTEKVKCTKALQFSFQPVKDGKHCRSCDWIANSVFSLTRKNQCISTSIAKKNHCISTSMCVLANKRVKEWRQLYYTENPLKHRYSLFDLGRQLINPLRLGDNCTHIY